MCGIAGFTRFSTDIGSEKTLIKMGEAMAHRGPDAFGSHIEEGVGLHHRRLAIIDLSAAGNQPMESSCNQFVIVFNGEIYNYQELRSDLVKRGCRFRTETDTEVILALYKEEGDRCLDKLNGMFAFAIWDRHEQSLFLARDRLGKKPLYYTFLDNNIAFASELKALLAADLIEKNVRLDAVRDFFAYQYVPDPKTIFEGVFKLEPGHSLSIDESGWSIQQYWDISFEVSEMEESTAASLLARSISEATRRRMISDVPLGAFLSGGVDSSGIVATMAEHSQQPVTTCSIGFDEPEFNETQFAQVVADAYETDHHEYTVGEKVTDRLREVCRFFDEPFADPSLVPTYFVSALARKSVTVALSGDGGDEIFAGYEKYSVDAIEHRWRRRLPKWLLRSLLPIASQLSRSSIAILRRASTLLRALGETPEMGFYLTNAQTTDEQWCHLALPQVQTRLGDYHPSQVTVETYRNCKAADHLSKILYTDLKTYLPGNILVKADRMSMAHSLEVRAPLLDYQVAELASSMAPELKFRNGEKKYILKKVFTKDLPEKLLQRKKMGFSPPLASWLREDLKELAFKTLFKEASGLSQYFEIEALEVYWHQHQRGSHDHSALLWNAMMFELWWEVYMSENSSTVL